MPEWKKTVLLGRRKVSMVPDEKLGVIREDYDQEVEESLNFDQDELEQYREPDPKYYGKKIRIKPNILKNLPENEKKKRVGEINDAILSDIGLFSDLVEQAKDDIVGDYVETLRQEVKVEQEEAAKKMDLAIEIL